MHCPTCGTDNPEKARFCLNCGSRLAARCGQCGAQLPPQAKSCLECGAPIGAPSAVLAASDATAALWRLVPQEYAERLLATRGRAGAERRTVTILFSDVKGSTVLAEHLDPEDVMEIMNGAFEHLIGPVYRHEGTLARLMGDAILAFFGAPICHEDDPERAIRAALEVQAGIRAYAVRLANERGIPDFSVRVGINTGLVVVGEVGSDLRMEYTAMGDAINLAARMEQNAPAGGILITHDTYRFVRGIFEVQPQPPLAVKGHAKPVRTYLVLGALPNAFGKAARGVEGIEVPMIGRDAELTQLQSSFLAVSEDGRCRMVTVAGDAGVGKSRLLYEFERWLETHPADHHIFKGRATPMAQLVPYGLMRDLFARRFAILESDSAAAVRDKLEQGIAGSLPADSAGPMKAHFIGHLLGYDFSDSPHLRGALNDARQLHDRARTYLADFFRAAAAQAPAMALLEDLHWADDSSLDALNHLTTTLAECPLLFVGAARPAFFERRPHWGEDQPGYTRLELRPLSVQASRRLVAEILQKVDAVPEALADLVVAGAEGNPFFAEELVKMLVEDGVIVKGASRQDMWQVERDRLTAVRVPDTLTGVLQARLDRLTLRDRSVLQQAAVVGRQFWDQAVAHINRAEGEEEVVPAALSALRAREMVFQRETSAFVGAQEYIFKHALLREVAYESLLRRLRRTYHGLVADWLIERGGERAGEITGLIGEHLELGGRAAEALDYLGRAAGSAAAKFANEEAIRYYRRALALLAGAGQTDGTAAALHEGLGNVLHLVSQHTQARVAYQQAAANLAPADRFGQARLEFKIGRTLVSERNLEGGQEAFIRAQAMLGPEPELTEVDWWQEWLTIQMERVTLHYWLHQTDKIELLVAKARPFVEQYGTPAQRALFFESLVRMELVRQRWRVTEEMLGYTRALLAAQQQVDDPHELATALFINGFCWLWYGDLDKATPQLQAATALIQRIGDISLLARCHTYVTIVHRRRGQVEETRQAAARSLEVATAAQMPEYMAMAKASQAWAAWRDGELAQTHELGRAALDLWSQLPLGRGSAPFLWLAMWPLIAVALQDEQFSEAIDPARAMLDPGQQPLPDALHALLEAAVQAAENDQPEASRTQFRLAMTLAQQTGYL